jgi:hypothetical protein
VAARPSGHWRIDASQPNPLSGLVTQHQELMAQDQDFRLTRGASLKDLAQYEHDPTRNAKITRCSILLGARRHADEVLKRHSFPLSGSARFRSRFHRIGANPNAGQFTLRFEGALPCFKQAPFTRNTLKGMRPAVSELKI